MAVATRSPRAATLDAAALLRRPGVRLSLTVDGVLAVAAYLAAYWLRFQGDRLEAFLPGAWSTMPWVVVGQLVALGITRAYARWTRVAWLIRVVVGIVA